MGCLLLLLCRDGWKLHANRVEVFGERIERDRAAGHEIGLDGAGFWLRTGEMSGETGGFVPGSGADLVCFQGGTRGKHAEFM